MSGQITTLNHYHSICDQLAKADEDLGNIIIAYGYPPLWTRPNTFESLVHIILEQQVSLASALAALNKLKERLPELTPANILSLTDEELKACYFSRQKILYTRSLAEALLNGQIDLEELNQLDNEAVRDALTKLKGVGNWTVDVYLMFVLGRADIFPVGDLAAVNALKRIKLLPLSTTKDEILDISVKWKPYRTVASMMLWHYYLSHKVL
ncbi:DNA-3-methyladenine glycosylase II [Pedobacter cryoconitis]|uniref:DNA-3-methyladenine glycosylase II n=1 Tax=Pedobacter cryoconitis TaxID=188932 RepID=A0A7W9DL56_9SPHI|nr:DNA-3-methyladenine glycosylase 2 family protein [Pedobacter cryoconitis]MBB5621805.1 DNA-3-methyladenine glycosylase II [Pedobacter cryoconitis]